MIRITGKAEGAPAASAAPTNGQATPKLINYMNMNNFSIFDPQVIQQVATTFPLEEKKNFIFALIRRSVRDYPAEVRKLLKDSAGIANPGMGSGDLAKNVINAIFNVPGFMHQFSKFVADTGIKQLKEKAKKVRANPAKYANLEDSGTYDSSIYGDLSTDTTTPDVPPADPAQKDVWDKIWGTVDRVSTIGLQVGGWFMNKDAAAQGGGGGQKQFTDQYKQFDNSQSTGINVLGIVKWVGIGIVLLAIIFIGGKYLIKAIKG